MSLKKQIKQAKEAIKLQKETVPWVFIEYNNMIIAKVQLHVAQKRYDEACKLWEQLGNN